MNNSEGLEAAFNKIVSKPDAKDVMYTGFADLDYVLSNTCKGSIITIGARPSMGKTAFCMSIFENLIRTGHKCLYITLELSEGRFYTRLLQMYAVVNIQHIKTKELVEREVAQLANAVNELENFDFMIIDDAVSVDKFEEYIKNYKPEYVFIDYLQLIQYKEKTPIEGISNILKQLKKIAKENNAFIFITSQLSRKVEDRYDRVPMLSDFRDSGAIEEISDVVLFIFRKEYYDREDSEAKNMADIIVAKNKFGPLGIASLRFEASAIKFFNPWRKF